MTEEDSETPTRTSCIVLDGLITKEVLKELSTAGVSSLEIRNKATQLNIAAAKALAGKIDWSCIERLSIEDQSKLGPRGVLPLAQAWNQQDSESIKLVELSIVGCRLGHFGVQALSPLLPMTLQNLNLSRNSIGRDGAWKLASFLPRLTNLVQLDLSVNGIGDEGCGEIATHLPKKLEILKLSSNEIADDGAKAIAKALMVTDSSSANDDNRSGNSIHDSSNNDDLSTSIHCTFSPPKNLLEVRLDHNRIEDDGATALMEMLDAQPQLVELELTENDIPSSRMHVLSVILQHRRAANKRRLNSSNCDNNMSASSIHTDNLLLDGTTTSMDHPGRTASSLRSLGGDDYAISNSGLQTILELDELRFQQEIANSLVQVKDAQQQGQRKDAVLLKRLESKLQSLLSHVHQAQGTCENE